MTVLSQWLLALWLVIGVATPALARDQVWFETPIAETTVGLEPGTDAPVQRAFYLAYVGPQEVIPNRDIARRCAELVVKPLRDRLRQTIVALDKGAVPAALSERGRYYVRGTSGALLAITILTKGAVLKCVQAHGAPNLEDTGFFLSLVQRDCVGEVCPISKTQRRRPGDEDSRVFTALYRWMAANSAVEQRNTTNQHFRLNFVGKESELFALQADFQPICEVNEWPDYSSPADCIIKVAPRAALDGDPVERLKALVANARRSDAPSNAIAFEAGLITGISPADFLRIADTLAGANEGYARADTTAKEVLKGVSNELARMRFTECRYYRGLSSLEDMTRCTGLSPDATSLAACMSASACEPRIPEEAQSIAFLIGNPRTLKDLASSSALPRYLPGSFGDTVKVYNECAAKTASGQAERCFRSELVASDPKLAALDHCFSVANDLKKTQCAVTALGGTLPREVTCAQLATERAKAECFLVPALPPDAQKLYECRDKTGSTLIGCVAGIAGGDGAKALACRANNAGSDLLFVECVAGGRIPPQLTSGLKCLGQTKAALSDVVACGVGAALPPDMSAQLGCALQAKGNPAGAVTCLVLLRSDLTQNQQLALQCLASSGGAPQAFAVCFLGQLTFQELGKCKGKEFGQDNCFGENNEFQKLAKLLTGDKISSNSVIGQIITVHLKVVVSMFVVVEPIADIATNAVARVGVALDRTKQDVDSALRGEVTGIVNTAFAPFVAPIRFFFPHF